VAYSGSPIIRLPRAYDTRSAVNRGGKEGPAVAKTHANEAKAQR